MSSLVRKWDMLDLWFKNALFIKLRRKKDAKKIMFVNSVPSEKSGNLVNLIGDSWSFVLMQIDNTVRINYQG